MKIERMNKGSWGKVRAFFDLSSEEGFTMKGFKLIEGINGLFVSPPSQKGNDGEYRDTIWIDSKNLRDQLNQLAINHYNDTSETLVEDKSNMNAEPSPTPEEPEMVPMDEATKVTGETTKTPETFGDDDIPF